ncbi:MAG: HAMP domain-containing histidine kinase [Ruminococcaceae bacterium]|nr:HAMP domain-containing histidine kinase [Oscillospiraceae bacterium]
MFKSVFSKYFTVLVLLISLGFTLIAGAALVVTANFHIRSQMESMQSIALSVQRYTESEFIRSKYSDFNQFVYYSKNDIVKNISLLTKYNKNTTVLLVNTEGDVLLNDIYSGDLTPNSISSEIFEEFKLGKGYDEINTLDDIYENKRITHGEVIYDSLRNPTAYVFVSTPYVLFGSFMKRLILIVLSFTIAASLSILLATYYISKRITDPLREISKAARSFALGKFDVRVPVKGNDELTELAIAFNNMAYTLEHNEETRRNFVANVSHDLRTPMTTISGFVDGILDGAIGPDKYEHYLSIIKTEVSRLSRLVSTLLDISRIQAGERKFNMEAFDICETAKLIIISFEQKIDEKKLNVEFVSDEDKMYVLADKDAIYQILYNLCDNAIKFSSQEGCLKLSIINKGGKTFVSVFNEGPGIEEKDLPYVFDRFYKTDKSRGLDKTGTGLGLFIAKTIINAHNEEIWVKSESGKNCEFIFTLKKTLKVQSTVVPKV